MEKIRFTQFELKKIIKYDPATGIITWKKRKYCTEGSVAGYKNPSGYIIIMINGVNYTASRLAWLYYYGEPPIKQVDHINHNRSDNRISNLRQVTNQENQMNRRFTGNSSGFRGVYWDSNRKKWTTNIKFRGINYNLGRFVDIEEAISTRLMAECHYGFHYNHGT